MKEREKYNKKIDDDGEVTDRAVLEARIIKLVTCWKNLLLWVVFMKDDEVDLA